MTLPPASDARIPVRFRFALVGKGLLLASLGGVFAAVAGFAGRAVWVPGTRPGPLVGALFLATLFFAYLAAFLIWNASLAWADALQGRAFDADGAIALLSRRAGHSFALKTGGFAEFVLWNPWEPLVPGARYRIRCARRSRVVVAPPEREPEPSPRAP